MYCGFWIMDLSTYVLVVTFNSLNLHHRSDVLISQSQCRSVQQALCSSSTAVTTLPEAYRWRDKSEPAQIEDQQGGQLIILDSDDEAPTTQNPPGAGSPMSSIQADMVVFQVLHCNPARLKRPLGSQDDMSSNDIALRKYNIIERSVGDDGNAAGTTRLRVQRCESPDISLLDLASVGLEALQRTMLKLEPDTNPVSLTCKLAELQPLVDAGAFPGSSCFYHDLGDDSTSLTMQGLAEKGLVTNQGLGDGQWSLTECAVNTCLENTMWLRSCGQAFAARPSVDIDKCTQLELQDMMTHCGWTSHSLRENEALAREPFMSGGPKRWFLDQNGRFFSSYACALLQSDAFFHSGLKSLHHGQIDSYYKAVIAVAQQRQKDKRTEAFDIMPFLPARTYRTMIKSKMAELPSVEEEKPLLAILPDPDGVQLSGLLMLEEQAPGPAAVQNTAVQNSVQVLKPPEPAAPIAAGPPRESRQRAEPRAEPKPRAHTAAKAASARRTAPHEKSHYFGDFYLAYYQYGAIPSWRAQCPYHENCSKSMRVNQEPNEDQMLALCPATLHLTLWESEFIVVMTT